VRIEITGCLAAIPGQGCRHRGTQGP